MDQESDTGGARTITIVGTAGGGSRARKRDIVEQPLDVGIVRKNFLSFLEGLKAIVDGELPAVGQFELDEVQFTAEIAADGQFKLLGTGVGLQASSGVTFTLRRKLVTGGGDG
jgi:hypothetical protein